MELNKQSNSTLPSASEYHSPKVTTLDEGLIYMILDPSPGLVQMTNDDDAATWSEN